MEPGINQLPPEVIAKLSYYVYLYIDPRNNKPFYVGKGQGNRIFAHQDVIGDCEKAKRLEEIRLAGQSPRLVIARHGLNTQEEAFAVEAALIEQIGLEFLVNKVAGHGTSKFGSMSLSQIHSRYAAEEAPAFIKPTLLFKLNQSFRYSMVGENASEHDRLELFEATRGTWKLGANKDKIKLAMAVYDGVIQEIYQIDSWQTGGTHDYTTIDRSGDHSDRWEFCGHRCNDKEIRHLYIGKSVRKMFKRGFAGSFLYGWPDNSDISGAA